MQALIIANINGNRHFDQFIGERVAVLDVDHRGRFELPIKGVFSEHSERNNTTWWEPEEVQIIPNDKRERMEFNPNKYIYVKFTEKAKKLYQLNSFTSKKPNKEGYYRFKFSEFCAIFGRKDIWGDIRWNNLFNIQFDAKDLKPYFNAQSKKGTNHENNR